MRARPAPPRSSATTSRTVVALAALLLLGGVAGCGDRGAPAASPGSSGGSASPGSPGGPGSSGVVAGSGSGASCAAAVRYQGHFYLMWGRPGHAPNPTGRTLPAVVPGCDDTGPAGPHEQDQPIRVDVLRATDPRLAVGYRGTLYVRQGAKPPAGPRWVTDHR
jgi:hypothetical protein